MSDARHQRFEIDIDEIERQLRRSVEATPSPKPDPLAELARIVGQDDPFRGILGGGRSNTVEPRPDAVPHAAEPRHEAARSFGEELAVASRPGPASLQLDDRGDDLLMDDDDLQPLQPRRSKSRLVAVVAALVLSLGAAGGFLVWRNAGSGFRLTGTGTPPVVTADQSPLKVAPDKPGGIEVPNQDRQIYERATPDGRSRVVDSREQPVDVREAVRNLPASPQIAPQVLMAAPGTMQDGATAASPSPNMQPGPTGTPLTAPPARAAVSGALGEPRRVRTVAVRPDGTTYTPPAGSGAPSAVTMPSSIVPGAGLPAPVPVTTTTIPVAPPSVAPAAPVAAAAPPESPPSGPAVTTLPPQRPKGLGRGADAGPDAAPAATPAAPVRVASAEASAPAAAATPARGGGFSVQLAVRPTEQEARAAYTQLLDRFSGDLEGRAATVTEAQVAGKTVHRIRVGPMSKDAANALCTKLKASGGQCFVAGT